MHLNKSSHKYRRRRRNKLLALYKEQGGLCYYCRKLMPLPQYDDRCYRIMSERNGPDHPTVDHIVPVSKGGSRERSNIVAACYRCNCNKGDSVGFAHQGAGGERNDRMR